MISDELKDEIRQTVRNSLQNETVSMFGKEMDRYNERKNVGKDISLVNFLDNYHVYNATLINRIPPKGAIIIADEGTTPTRVIAVYLSLGDSLVEISAKVI